MEEQKIYNHKIVEPKILNYWEEKKIFKFNPKKIGEITTIDTPPPTLSGKMHIGHTFSYSQQDFIVRYHRMKGENVYYPFGTDDNGLPTERLVEKLKNVSSVRMQRNEFVELCSKTITELKPDFIQDWKNIGMSCDFSNSYSTIDKHSIKTSQKSFIDLYNKKLVYQQEAPSMFCVQCQTAIAQADLEDKEQYSTFNDIYFELENKEKIIIATTRPELLAACVAIFVHPQDKRYKSLIGKLAIVPLFGQKVKIYSDESVEIEKGTGLLMICSFGDKKDVEAIKKRNIKSRVVFTRDGRLNELAGEYKGLKIKEARKKILEDLESKKLLVNKKLIKHTVNVHERCGTEIEFLSTKQWFIKILENKKKFIEAGKKIKWHPETMRLRYENWIEGLSWDWCISRQRHFGVPFPVWYCKKCNDILLAEEKELPVDPLFKNPNKKCKCGSNEFYAEQDVMDTWATSSLTPQIAFNWFNDKDFKIKIEKYPASYRFQSHDIIRTWAFYTIVKSIYHHNEIPWKDIVISGHVLDPKGESMHKSKSNAVEPKLVLEKYGADALRYWAAGSKLGEDLRYLEKDLVTGQKTVTKLWNSNKFGFIFLKDYKFKENKKIELIDKWILAKLNQTIKNCTEYFENYEYSKAKTEVDQFFWHILCDNYLEIIKDRLYNEKRTKEEKESAKYTLYIVLRNVLKLFAPIMPFITEEIYQDYFKENEKNESIHLSQWPEISKVDKIDNKIIPLGDEFVEVLTQVRQTKAKAGKSLKEIVKILTVNGNKLKDVEIDLKAVTKAEKIVYGKEIKVEM